VAWVFEDGASESHLIRPAPAWTDWDEQAEAIHHIPRDLLVAEGRAHDWVAQRMIEQLQGHDLLATAPSWDGKWLSVLLRSADLPRHSLRLRDSDEALRECAISILTPTVRPDALAQTVENLLVLTEARDRRRPPAHRALADAQQEHDRWRVLSQATERLVARAE
jgi:hypothetical protein